MGGTFYSVVSLFSEAFCDSEILFVSFLSINKGSCPKYDNSAISLVANNIILPLIGSLTRAPNHASVGIRPCLFHVTEKGHGRVTEPEGDHLISGRNLGMNPKTLLFKS